jgi:hypothetical protein
MAIKDLEALSLYNLVVVVVIYWATYDVVAKVFTPLQVQFVSNSDLSSLLFLPHGVRVLTCIIYGARWGEAYLLIASLVKSIFYGTIVNHEFLTQLLLIAVGALSVPAAFIFLKFIHEDTKVGLTQVRHNTFKTILYLSLISSVINSLVQSLVIDGLSDFTVQPRIILKFLIGDMLGTLVVFVTLRFFLNRIKLS